MNSLSHRIVAAILVSVPGALPAAAQPAAAPPSGKPSVRDINVDQVPRLDNAGIYRAQQLLKGRGFDPSRFDGIYGTLTRGAVINFQTKYGIRPRGEIDNQTLLALGAADLAAPGDPQGR